MSALVAEVPIEIPAARFMRGIFLILNLFLFQKLNDECELYTTSVCCVRVYNLSAVFKRVLLNGMQNVT